MRRRVQKALYAISSCLLSAVIVVQLCVSRFVHKKSSFILSDTPFVHTNNIRTCPYARYVCSGSEYTGKPPMDTGVENTGTFASWNCTKIYGTFSRFSQRRFSVNMTRVCTHMCVDYVRVSSVRLAIACVFFGCFLRLCGMIRQTCSGIKYAAHCINLRQFHRCTVEIWLFQCTSYTYCACMPYVSALQYWAVYNVEHNEQTLMIRWSFI